MNSGFDYALNYLKNPSNDIIGKSATITANRANVDVALQPAALESWVQGSTVVGHEDG